MMLYNVICTKMYSVLEKYEGQPLNLTISDWKIQLRFMQIITSHQYDEKR